jgi:hypothetical protein
MAKFRQFSGHRVDRPAMSRFSYRTVLPWLSLAAVLFCYIAFIARLHPIDLFGTQEDDSIYFSSAKAIAEGKGYILPSLPGGPPAANRYPIFYPWMLSWVWRWNPSFPANINDGVALTVAFGLAYLTFAFVFFRRSMKLSDAEALALTAFCAFQPVVLFRSATILSDIPFAALSLGALVLADTVTKRNGSRTAAIVCGILAGLSILTRTTGYPIAAGILALAILRKAWRQAAVFGSTVAAFFAFYVWETLSAAKAVLPAGWSTFGPGFRQTWLFYTNYLGFRELSIVNPRVVGVVFLNQFIYLCTQVPSYFLSPFFGRNVVLLFISTVALLWLICAGFVRTTKLDGWKPIHVALVLYIALVLAWNYPSWDRFLIPFLPLFVASLWMEAKWIAREVSREAHEDQPRGTRIASLAVGFALAILAVGMSWNFLANRDRRDLLANSRDRAKLLVEKSEAYDWIRHNSPDDARIVAAEDGCVYLYTGRESMEPIAMLPVGFYEPEQMQSDLSHITDVATAIGATYWVTSFDDSDKQAKDAKPQLAARLDEIEGVLPELFRSDSGNVRIYGLDCLRNPQGGSCRSADRVLFPDGHWSTNAQGVAGTLAAPNHGSATR